MHLPVATPPATVVAMLGARMHYAVPRLLHAAGALHALHVDLAGQGLIGGSLRLLPEAILPGALRGWRARQTGIPTRLVTQHVAMGLRYGARLRRMGGSEGRREVFLWGGQAFARSVVASGALDGGAGAVFGYNSAMLELLLAARERGLLGVVEQTILPRLLEHRILEEEFRAYEGYQHRGPLDGSCLEEHAEREAAEWQAASLVFCGSDVVAEGIRQLGGPADRLRVVPYGVAPPAWVAAPRPPRGPEHRLRVLFVGQLGLRKGAHYLIQAARLLQGEPFEFHFVGLNMLTDKALTPLPDSIHLHGHVPRAEVATHLGCADVLCLPSLVEGSATVTYEALAAGLPLLVTREAGSMVRDGVDGLVIPARSAQAIADGLRQLRERPLPMTSAKAQGEAPPWSIAAYGQRLLSALAAR